MGNSFNIVKELDQISRLIQECKVTGKRTEDLGKALGEFSVQLKQAGPEAITQFNHYGGTKNWKTLAVLIKNEDSVVVLNTLKILAIILQNKESIDPFLNNKMLPDLMTILAKRDVACKRMVGEILAMVSEDSKVVTEMRNQQLEVGIADFLHQHKRKLRVVDKDFATELEARMLCIQTVANILAWVKEEKNKFNFVRARGLEAICALSDTPETRDCIKPSMCLLANMATNLKIQEEMDFNGSVEDLTKNMKETDGELALFHCGRFLFLMIENESFLTKLLKNQTFEEMAELCKKVKDMRYTYLMFLLLFLRLNTTQDGAECIAKIPGLRKRMAAIKSAKIIDQDLEDPNFGLLMDCILKMTNQIKLPGVNLSALPNMVYIVANVLDLLCIRISGKRSAKPTEKQQEVERVLLSSLFNIVINLSLSYECQTMLRKANTLDYLYKLSLYEVAQCKDEMASQALLDCLKATTNLFMQLPLWQLNRDQKFTELFLDLQNWGASSAHQDYDLSRAMREDLKLILMVLPSLETTTDMHQIARFFLKCLYSSDDLIVYKALGCLNILIQRDYFKAVVVENKLHKVLLNMMLRLEPFLARQAVACLYNLLRGPAELILWMKFSCNKIEMDSSIQNFVLRYGDPKRVTAMKIEGFYQDWGVRTHKDDMFFLPDFPELAEFSISVWYLLPSKPRTYFSTLLQGEDGVGGLIVINPELDTIGAFDEVTGDFITLLDLKAQKNRFSWQNLILLVRKNDKHSPTTHSIDVFHNGEPTSLNIEINVLTLFQYVGNSKKRDEPFGVFADLRIYECIINTNLRQSIVDKTDFPDKVQEKLEEGYCCAKVVEKLKVNDPELQIELCGLIRGLCANSETKLGLLKEGVFNALMPILLRSNNEELQEEVSMAVTYLG